MGSSQNQDPLRESFLHTPAWACMLLAGLLAFSGGGRAALGQAEQPDPEAIQEVPVERLWEDFIHGIKVARWDMAMSNAQAIIRAQGQAREIYLLAAETPELQGVLTRGERLEGLTEPIERIRQIIEQGYESERADPKQISNSIDMLAKSIRAYQIGAERLATSGEYAMPQLIQKLTDSMTPGILRERIITVLPKLGRGAVRPLSEVLQARDPELLEIAAHALGQIGYPQAAPQLKALTERDDVLARTREVATSALLACAGPAALNRSVAALYYEQAEKYYYRAESVAPAGDYPTANVWFWRDGLGLSVRPAPREIFHDIYAMRMCRLALEADANFHPAVSLWLAAKMRKDVDLPAGMSDPTQGPDEPSAEYFALASSARYLQEVLHRALRDQESAVALKAIEALAKTAGAQNLVAPTPGGVQPLVEALGNANREVRFMAATTLANAQPQRAFAGSAQVMSVLIEALRQTGTKRAMVIATEPNIRNLIKEAARGLGYEVLDRAEPNIALAEGRRVSGVDVVLLADRPEPSDVVGMLRREAIFAGVPVVATIPDERIRRIARPDGRIVVMEGEFSAAAIPEAIRQAVQLGSGEPLTPDQAAEWAVRAAGAVYTLGVMKNPVFDTSLAEEALISALFVQRRDVRLAVAQTLGVMDSAPAQQAIAEVALDGQEEESLRVEMFGVLSGSIRRFGNQLTESQAEGVIDVVMETSSRQLRDSAAQVLGSMNLPSEKIQNLFLEKWQN